ncbi:dixin-like isoform X2 [Denticeps clupeoides]|uniref:dixin-like isoform X2 n=1 Tax=Denticeps clupeoides TaxID=299321 RepID=UPI0010A4EE9B|nr:dixin-like isoform X2 [Denticeps clupeoides]
MIASLSKGNLLDVLQEGFNQQLAAYVSWVNGQLQKKPGVKLVHDLHQDLRDGVVLAHLIEIVAEEVLDGIHYTPCDTQEKKENVEKVLEFMTSKRIRMPQASSRDIVEGNLKSAMRLILALAAHFKPSASSDHRTCVNTRRSLAGASTNHRPRSTVAMAQTAVAALTAARQDASRPCRSVRTLRQEWSSQCSSVDEKVGGSCRTVRALVQQYEGQHRTPEEDPGIRLSCIGSSSPTHSPQVSTEDGVAAKIAGMQPDWMLGGRDWDDQICDQQEQLETEIQEARKMVVSLQALLLCGSLSEDKQEASLGLGEGVENGGQQLIVTRSRLDQSMEESRDLKRELLKLKQEGRNLQGIKDALQQRMAIQEESVLQLKEELLRTSMARDELAGQNAELQQKLEERSNRLSDYMRETAQKEQLIQQQQQKLTSLQNELQHKDSMLHELMSHTLDKVHPSCPQTNSCSLPAFPALSFSQTHRGAEELQLVRDSLRSLRSSFGGHDPQHHTLDTLEQSLGSLMDRLHALDNCHQHYRKVRGTSPECKATPTDHNSRPPSSTTSHSNRSAVLSSPACTKVLYFTDHSPTPFMISIAKRLGEVTLHDFKAAIDKEGNHRYHFKSLDPEFGTVKEEVFHNEAVIPGWEGKIVAWVEEDYGEGR